MAALGFEVLFGALTITGSFMAFGKLQEILPSRPVTFKGQNIGSIGIFAAAIVLFVWLIVDPAHPGAFYAMVVLALVFGVSLVLPIGGADMPVVISLLNSYAGLASAATGFAIGNNVLIIAGALGPYDREPGGRLPGGWWFATEVEVELGPEDVFRPDVEGWRRERMEKLPSQVPIVVPPRLGQGSRPIGGTTSSRRNARTTGMASRTIGWSIPIGR